MNDPATPPDPGEPADRTDLRRWFEAVPFLFPAMIVCGCLVFARFAIVAKLFLLAPAFLVVLAVYVFGGLGCLVTGRFRGALVAAIGALLILASSSPSAMRVATSLHLWKMQAEFDELAEGARAGLPLPRTVDGASVSTSVDPLRVIIDYGGFMDTHAFVYAPDGLGDLQERTAFRSRRVRGPWHYCYWD